MRDSSSNKTKTPPGSTVATFTVRPAITFLVSASRYFGDKKTLCLYWPLATVVITGPKVLDFYAGFCANRATCVKADGSEITNLKLILNGDSNSETEAGPLKG
jgi:hypothetical protein